MHFAHGAYVAIPGQKKDGEQGFKSSRMKDLFFALVFAEASNPQLAARERTTKEERKTAMGLTFPLSALQ